MKIFSSSFLTLIILIFITTSCSDNCKSLNGNKFINFSSGIRYSYITSYKFSGNSVSMLSMSKVGSDEYKKDNSQEGYYSINGENIRLNFGGSDVYLFINKNSEGCITSLSNELGTYQKK